MKGHPINFVGRAAGEDLICSRCDESVELLVQIELLTEDKRGLLLVGGKPAWIGWCERCIATLHAGFARAREKYYAAPESHGQRRGH